MKNISKVALLVVFVTTNTTSNLYVPSITIFDTVSEHYAHGTVVSKKGQLLVGAVGLFTACASLYLLGNGNPDQQKLATGVKIGFSAVAASFMSYFTYLGQKPEHLAAQVSEQDRRLLKIMLDENGLNTGAKLKKLYNYQDDYMKKTDEGVKRLQKALHDLSMLIMNNQKKSEKGVLELLDGLYSTEKQLRKRYKALKKPRCVVS